MKEMTDEHHCFNVLSATVPCCDVAVNLLFAVLYVYENDEHDYPTERCLTAFKEIAHYIFEVYSENNDEMTNREIMFDCIEHFEDSEIHQYVIRKILSVSERYDYTKF